MWHYDFFHVAYLQNCNVFGLSAYTNFMILYWKWTCIFLKDGEVFENEEDRTTLNI